MYHAKLWDEDKWNIHSQSYSSSKYGSVFSEDKKEDKKYHEQKYGQADKEVSSDYMKKDEAKEKEDIKEDDIQFKAAKQVFSEQQHEMKKPARKKDINTIEDAIKKAIEEEKKVIVMDN